MNTNKTKISEAKFLSYLKSLGFLFPETDKELDRFNELYLQHKYEHNGKGISPQKIIDEVKKEEASTKENKTKNANYNKDYFKRIVLAAEITSQLYYEPTFGHVKFQKLMYLCEHYANLHLTDRYEKQAAGPYDRKFMHSIDYQFKRLKWFSVTKKGNTGKYTYKPMDQTENYKGYYNRYFSKYNKNIQWLIETFRSEKSDFVELIATLHACIEEALGKKEKISKNSIMQKFYSWSEEKKRFNKEDVEEALGWMFEKGFTTLKLI